MAIFCNWFERERNSTHFCNVISIVSPIEAAKGSSNKHSSQRFLARYPLTRKVVRALQACFCVAGKRGDSIDAKVAPFFNIDNNTSSVPGLGNGSACCLIQR